jgi:hypothetical protein
MSTTLCDLIELLYGALPPAPVSLACECRAALVTQTQSAALPKHTSVESWRLNLPDLQVRLRVLRPHAQRARAAIVCGDDGWRTLSDGACEHFLRSSHALVWFDRTDFAPDVPAASEKTLFCTYAAISAWAWGYSRVADAIQWMPSLKDAPLVFTGHSRGGKAALLAGALDDRASATHANNSGALGAGSHVVQGEGSETWAMLARGYPHWVSAALRERNETASLPFDQDVLLGAIAPRRLLITQASDDAWANPLGTRHIVNVLRSHRQGIGLNTEHVQLVERTGGHATCDADWVALATFLDAHV